MNDAKLGLADAGVEHADFTVELSQIDDENLAHSREPPQSVNETSTREAPRGSSKIPRGHTACMNSLYGSPRRDRRGFFLMVLDDFEHEPQSPIRRRAIGVGLVLLGVIILLSLVAARAGLERDPPRDLPGRVFCELVIDGFALVGLALVTVGGAYSFAMNHETVHRLMTLVMHKLLWFVIAFVERYSASRALERLGSGVVVVRGDSSSRTSIRR